MRSQLRVLRCRGPVDNRAASIGFPRLSVPTDRLGAGGGQYGVRVFIGRSSGKAVVRDVGIDQPDILHLIQVSLKKIERHDFLHALSFLPIFPSVALIPG
jgi:hypothetical protein